ncbi:MAG: CDP-alcohol phosphatidyltransferase family protein [Chitinophagales bacterium]|nr:CDP-alcohol phosphatidyltransferase family protein [Chitinophagales bacterium]
MQLFNLPNLLTLINLFSGCLAVVFAFSYHIDWVPYCVLVSLVADFFDGFAARFIKTNSDLGKQLDSLADVVSFGLVPGLIVFWMLNNSLRADIHSFSDNEILLASAPAFLLTLFAALRLAKFNIDTRQTDGFIGLATPASTMFVTGILLMVLQNSFGFASLLYNKFLLYSIILFLSYLMVAELPMFSFKFKSYNWAGNEWRYLFIILSLILLVALKFAAVSLIVILYIILSVTLKIINK